MVQHHHLRHGIMTLITLQDGKIVVRDGQVGTEQACCCGCPNYIYVNWIGFSVGLNDCARCGEYLSDRDTVLAGVEAFATGVLTTTLEARGFSVGPYVPIAGPDQLIEDYTTCPGDAEPCDALWWDSEPGSLCITCDGVVEENLGLDPLPTEVFDDLGNEAFANTGVLLSDLAFDFEYKECNPLP